MSKFLFLSGYGEGLGVALRLKENGHQVATWIRDKRSKFNYDGLIKKVQKWETYLDADTIVVFDSTGGGRTADRLKARGHHIFGGSTFTDSLESDRALSFELMKQVGIKTPMFKSFFSWEDGRNFARRHKGRLVFKASGQLANDNHVTSYVSSDGEDLAEMLTHFESVATKPPEFELQEFVENGYTISTEGWFNGEDWIYPFNHSVEEKALMNDNLGPSGGCSGNSVWRCDNLDFVVEEGLAKMAPILREYGYIGCLDLNCIVNPDGVWALEFTPRFGYDSIPVFINMYEGDPGELIAKMAMGEKPKEFVMKSGFGSALRISVPPYPSEEHIVGEGVPVRGFEKADRPNLYFYNVMLDDKNNIVTSGSYGIVAVTTGLGSTIKESFETPYALAKKAKIPEKQYRTDMAKVLEETYNSWHQTASVKHNQLQEAAK